MSEVDNNQAPQPVFSIEKLYVKDLSIEAPNSPQSFMEREPPQINVDLSTAGHGLDTGFYEVALTVTVSAKNKEDKALFLVEVTQAGIFQIRNIPEEHLEAVLMVGCANILFPYAREAVSDSVSRAGFQPVILNPVNFEALYEARAQEANESASTQTLQ